MTLLGGFGQGNANTRSDATIPAVSEQDFEAEVLRSELPVLLMLSSERSTACKQMTPVLGELARELEGKAKVLKLDVDRSPYIAQQLRVQSVPTFLVWAGGRPADMQPGPLGKKQLLAMLEPVLPRQAGALKPLEAAQLLGKKLIVAVDTRDKAAFDRARLPGAVHMPLEELESRIAELYMLPGQPVLYCRAGDKTREFVAKMSGEGVELGFVEGGLLGWESESLPIER